MIRIEATTFYQRPLTAFLAAGRNVSVLKWQAIHNFQIPKFYILLCPK